MISEYQKQNEESTSSLVYVLETLGTLRLQLDERLRPWDFQSKWQFENTSVVKSPSLSCKGCMESLPRVRELGMGKETSEMTATKQLF